MRRFIFSLCLAACLHSLPASAWAAEPPLLAVLPFEILDRSGEQGPADRHDAMLAAVARLLREEVAESGLYRVVPGPEAEAAVAAADLGTWVYDCNGCDRKIARELRADRVMTASFYKVSSLVLSLRVRIRDVESGREIYLRGFDFRGDNEAAWRHATTYMVRKLRLWNDGAATPTAIQ